VNTKMPNYDSNSQQTKHNSGILFFKKVERSTSING
jgi:hypothetical protein